MNDKTNAIKLIASSKSRGAELRLCFDGAYFYFLSILRGKITGYRSKNPMLPANSYIWGIERDLLPRVQGYVSAHGVEDNQTVENVSGYLVQGEPEIHRIGSLHQRDQTYRTNLNDPKIEKLYREFKESRGIPKSVTLSDSERAAFDSWALDMLAMEKENDVCQVKK